MALLNPISTEHGAIAFYWKITSVVFELDHHCVITVSGFLNQDTRNANQSAMKTLTFTTQFPNGFSLIDAYAYLKTLPEFILAEDA